MITIKNLSYSYKNAKPDISDITLDFSLNNIIGILGPNGAGKTTFLKILLGIIKNYQGEIKIQNKPHHKFSQRDLAKQFAYVGPNEDIHFKYTVWDIVAMGRFPYVNFFGALSNHDKNIIAKVIAEFELEALQHKFISELSSGEKQRVSIARAFAQQSQILLLDEPLSHLDLFHSNKITKVLKEKYFKEKKGLIIVSHDTRFLSEFSEKIILLKQGKIFSYGKTEEILTSDLINELFDIK